MNYMSPIIIIGMHRSGTSMFSRLLSACGIYLGRDLSINAESKYFQNLNRNILTEAGGRWCDILIPIKKMESVEFINRQVTHLDKKLFQQKGVFSFFSELQRLKLFFGHNPRNWGWKDPRNSITLPIWLKIFPNARVIQVIRNGIDVAISLHRRQLKYSTTDKDYCKGCQSFIYCFELWEQYLRACNENKKSVPPERYLEINYEALLQTPKENLITALDFLNCEISDRKLENLISEMINHSRLDNNLFRQQYQTEIANLSANPLMVQLGYG